MKKFCIFCGKEPESKNREHVIPQWLIKLTGDPHREVFLGIKWNSPSLKERRFSLNSFTLPACEACNNEAADLEAKTKLIVKDILARKPLRSVHWDTFLDWLDKVRTGLWFGIIYLNENYLGLMPNFYINQRIGSKDRFLIIYQIEDDRVMGLSWGLTDSPLFQNAPSCFTLTINNFLFFNASYDFLFSQRFGFPFPYARWLLPEGKELAKMAYGTGKVQLPLIEKKFKTGGTQLFQPMIPYGVLLREKGELAFRDCYDNEYVRTNCMDYEKGRGVILRRHRNELVKYSTEPSKEWIPNQRFPREQIIHQAAVLAGEFLADIYRKHPSFDRLPEEQRKKFEKKRDDLLRLHKKMMKEFTAQKKMYY
jgi:hypothetical protein